ncbi:uncharacterized protein LOC124889562 [Capsicum annuum]|uniref:uncharacterized protein LOC124889562 n=1 Tax=Capsicum annuum TaxID=4072 RepID=UPI001FB0DFE2|nr:uncharacterized protein LOC124889562 [Capsicum annuum]
MKNGESIADFLSKTVAIVSKIRSYGEKVTDQTIMEKILRSSTPKFDHVVAAIEESKDLSVFSFDELMGSFQAHETRPNLSTENNEEKAFQVKDATSKYGENNGPASKGRGRRGFRGGRGHGYGRGRGRNDGQKQSNEQGNKKNSIQCNHYHRYGHMRADCWYIDQKINFAAGENKEKNYLCACIDTNHKPIDLWFVDSSCSNHMTGAKSLFKELDEKQKKMVQLCNTKEMQVEGKGTMGVDTSHDKVKILNNVQFVPDLGYNLLSVGQLMIDGHSLWFDDDACVIINKKSGKRFASP